MRHSSTIYKDLVQKIIDKYGPKAEQGFISDIQTLTENVKLHYEQMSLEKFKTEMENVIINDFEAIRNDKTLNYALKFIDFQHFYVAFRNLELKYPNNELERSLNKLRHILDEYCSEMANNLVNFKIN